MTRNHFALKHGSNNFFNSGIICIRLACDHFGKLTTDEGTGCRGGYSHNMTGPGGSVAHARPLRAARRNFRLPHGLLDGSSNHV
jgi:hypothetical protein